MCASQITLRNVILGSVYWITVDYGGGGKANSIRRRKAGEEQSMQSFAFSLCRLKFLDANLFIKLLLLMISYLVKLASCLV